MTPARRREHGSLALELVLLTPIFLILLDFAVLGGRISSSEARVDAAAHAAARAASLQRTATAADSAARAVAADTLPQVGSNCHSLDVAIDTSAFRPGGVVVVRIECAVNLSDLAWLPVPGAHDVVGSSTSAVDTYRSASR